MRKERITEELAGRLYESPDKSFEMSEGNHSFKISISNDTPRRVFNNKNGIGYQVAYKYDKGSRSWTIFSASIEDEKHLESVMALINKKLCLQDFNSPEKPSQPTQTVNTTLASPCVASLPDAYAPGCNTGKSIYSDEKTVDVNLKPPAQDTDDIFESMVEKFTKPQGEVNRFFSRYIDKDELEQIDYDAKRGEKRPQESAAAPTTAPALTSKLSSSQRMYQRPMPSSNKRYRPIW